MCRIRREKKHIPSGLPPLRLRRRNGLDQLKPLRGLVQPAMSFVARVGRIGMRIILGSLISRAGAAIALDRSTERRGVDR
jgi:hypothetical protein